MTRKDYIDISGKVRAVLAEVLTADAERAVSMLAHEIANVMADDNPRFDRDRFMAACGVTAW